MKKLYIILGSVTLVGIIGLLVWYFFLGMDVKLIDEEKVIATVNVEYRDAGFTVKQHGKDIDKEKYSYEEQNNVDTSKLGEYKVSYDIKYRLRKFHLERIVEVKDNIKP